MYGKIASLVTVFQAARVRGSSTEQAMRIVRGEIVRKNENYIIVREAGFTYGLYNRAGEKIMSYSSKRQALTDWCTHPYSGDTRPYCEGTFEHYDEEDLTDFNGELFCQEWLDDNTFICEGDGERYHNEDGGEFEGGMYSNDWLNNHTFCCENCGERHFDNDSTTVYFGRRSQLWCTSCAENNAYYWESDSEYHSEPEEEVNDLGLHCHDYKPVPRFQGNGPVYFGLEIEMECITEISDKKFWYVKSDSSLDGDTGAELVTHPFDYNFWLQTGRQQLKAELDNLADNGGRSWDRAACGLHIHVSKKAWNSKLHVAKTLEFLRCNPDMVLMLSRRKDRRVLEHWSGLDYSETSTQIGKAGSQSDRYHALNLKNSQTNEFRIFKGTMNMESIDTYLDTVRAIIEYTRTASWQDLTDTGFYLFVGMNRKAYKALAGFLVSKGKISAPKARKELVAA